MEFSKNSQYYIINGDNIINIQAHNDWLLDFVIYITYGHTFRLEFVAVICLINKFMYIQGMSQYLQNLEKKKLSMYLIM